MSLESPTAATERARQFAIIAELLTAAELGTALELEGSTPSPSLVCAISKCRRHSSGCGAPFVQMPQEECEGAEHPNVLAARDQDPASWDADLSGPEHSLASGRPLAQTRTLDVAQAQCATEGGADHRLCCDCPRGLFRDKSRLSCGAKAHRGVCSREWRVQ